MSSGTTPLLLDVRDLCVRYTRRSPASAGLHLAAVSGVSFTLAQGQSLGLVGESGSGKSSIARALLRLIPATGQALFQGRDLLRLRGSELRAARAQLQIVFQDPQGALDPRMNVLELVSEPLLEFPRTAQQEPRTLVLQMLARVGLGAELLARFPHQLSGGQAQRVGLARALMLEPRLLICDEPVAALDVSIKSQIANLLRDMRDQLQLSLLFIAHDLATVRYLCDHVVVLYLGRVMEAAPRDSLYDAPQHPYTRALLAASPVPDPSRAQPVVSLGSGSSATEDTTPGCVFRTRCPLAVARCATETPLPRLLGPSLVACHRADE